MAVNGVVYVLSLHTTKSFFLYHFSLSATINFLWVDQLGIRPVCGRAVHTCTFLLLSANPGTNEYFQASISKAWAQNNDKCR